MSEDAAAEFIAFIDDSRRRDEAQRLDALFRNVTGYAPRLWSGRVIGYGAYEYTYASGHGGRAFATGFAVARRHLTIYVMPGYAPFPDILARLGKHRKGKACLYLTRLEDANEEALRDLIRAGLDDLATRWTVEPS